MRKLFLSLWESVKDGVVDMVAHPARSVLQCVGIVLGVASVVATFGLIDGGKRRMTEFFDKTGGIRKMLIRNLDTDEAVKSALERNSRGLTYDDALALAREATTLELVEPTMIRTELVKTPGYEKELEIGPSMRYQPLPQMNIDFAPLIGIGADARAADLFLVVGWEL